MWLIGGIRALLRFARGRRYIGAMNAKIWKQALKEAKRELEAATGRTTLNTAAKKLMGAKAELKRLEQQAPTRRGSSSLASGVGGFLLSARQPQSTRAGLASAPSASPGTAVLPLRY